MDWYLEVRLQGRDRQYSFCLLILEIKGIKILHILTSLYHVEHNTCTVHGRNIKTRYLGLILILRFEKDWHSIRLDRMQSSFKEYFQLIVFQKLLEWKLHKSYTKVYMSPRPPPKISLKHEWKRELGSEHAQRSEVGQLSQLNQPILSPIRERTGRPVVKDDTRTVQDGRKTSRSQEIDINSFNKETVSSDRSGGPVVETSVIQARSSEDSKDPNVGTAHERTRRLVTETNTENVPDSSQTRPYHGSETFNVGDVTLRDRTGEPRCKPWRFKSWNNDVERGEHGLLNSRVSHILLRSVHKVQTFDNWFRKLRTTQTDMLFNNIHDKNKAHNPFNPESKWMIQDVGNVELFELFETDLKTQW